MAGYVALTFDENLQIGKPQYFCLLISRGNAVQNSNVVYTKYAYGF